MSDGDSEELDSSASNEEQDGDVEMLDADGSEDEETADFKEGVQLFSVQPAIFLDEKRDISSKRLPRRSLRTAPFRKSRLGRHLPTSHPPKPLRWRRTSYPTPEPEQGRQRRLAQLTLNTVLGVYPGVEPASPRLPVVISGVRYHSRRPMPVGPRPRHGHMAEPVQRLRQCDVFEVVEPRSPTVRLRVFGATSNRGTCGSWRRLSNARTSSSSHTLRRSRVNSGSASISHISKNHVSVVAQSRLGMALELGPGEAVDFRDESFVPDDDDPDDFMHVEEIVDLAGILQGRLGQRLAGRVEQGVLVQPLGLLRQVWRRQAAGQVKVERTVTWAGRHIRGMILSCRIGPADMSSLVSHRALDIANQELLGGKRRRWRRIRLRVALSRQFRVRNTYSTRNTHRRESARTLSDVGCARDPVGERWRDLNLFLRAAEVCKARENIDILGVNALVSAYRAFDWSSMVDFCDNDNWSSRRSALLARLTGLAAEENGRELARWTRPQEDEILRDLGDVDADDIPRLVEVASSGVNEFFTETLLPQLAAIQMDAGRLHRATSRSQRGAADLCRCFRTTRANERTRTPTRSLTPSLFLDIRELDACSRLFVKMRDAARSGTFTLDYPPWLYYEALASLLAALIGDDEVKLQAFR
uniref:Uncharacterized protein n=1 Tax=Mycena chlorophos TaxID=658473 RepID=A0ABQ0LDG0_MYCCL|nr:predicted protein [Mycena chlorophos]